MEVIMEGPATATHHSLQSSYREMLLEHLFAGELMRYCWLKGLPPIDLMKPQVDRGGYDLVLESNSVVRHVQLKASFDGAATAAVNVNLALAEKPSGCVIWTLFDRDTLHFVRYLWFGGAPGQGLPDLTPFKTARHAKGNAQGIKAERLNIRTLPKSAFTILQTVDEVVERLFGTSR